MKGGLRGRGRLREHCRLEAVRVQKDVTRVFNLERRVAPVSAGAHTGKWQGLLTPLFPRLQEFITVICRNHIPLSRLNNNTPISHYTLVIPS